MLPGKSKGNTFRKRRRRPLTHVKSGIALSTLSIPTPLPARLGGPLKRGRSKSSLTRMNSKGIELNTLGEAGKGKKQIEEVVVAKESFLTSRTARVLLAGAGFLADAYDLFIINLVLRLLKDEYPQYAMSGQLHLLEGSVASAALIGSIFGQLVAGSLADIIGRKRIFVATAALITIGCIGSACALDTPSLTIYGQIACWRTLLGAGVGGEYPLAATVTSESSSAGKRGSLMSAVFAMQGIGSLLSGCVVFICLFFKCSTAFTWRFALAFGALPVMIAFPYRLRMHETESFARLQQERANAKANTTKNNALVQAERTQRHNRKQLLKPTTPTHNGTSNNNSMANSNVMKTEHEIMHIEEGIPLFSPMHHNQPYYQSLNDTKSETVKRSNSSNNNNHSNNKINSNNNSMINSPLVPLSGNLGKLQIRNNELIGTDNQLGAFVTTDDGQFFFHHEEENHIHSANINSSTNMDNNYPASVSTSISSSLRPSTNNTSSNNNVHLNSNSSNNSSSKNNSNSNLVKKVSDTALAAVSALPPAKKAELISVFHRPVTPSSSPVQTLTDQHMAAQQKQNKQHSSNTGANNDFDNNNINNTNSSTLAIQETEAPPVTTMMDVFRQFHRYRTNSADLTDDYGLYHIDSRHNSSNYSQTMLHMMSSSYSNSVIPPTLQSIQQQQSIQTTSPHSQNANNNVTNALNNDQFMATPMFAKVKSRGLLSKSPALSSSGNINNSPSSPLPQSVYNNAYPAPASSLMSNANSAIYNAKTTTSSTTNSTSSMTMASKHNKQRRYSHERPTAPNRKISSSHFHPHKSHSNNINSNNHHSYDLLNEEELLEDGEEILEIALQDNSYDDYKDRHKNNKSKNKKMKHKTKYETDVNEEEEEEEEVGGFSDDISGDDKDTEKRVTCCGSSRFAETWRVFVIYRYHILGTALSWFLLDVVFYANGLFNHEVTSHIFSSASNNNGENSLLSPPSLTDNDNHVHHISARYLSESEHIYTDSNMFLHSPYSKAISYLSMSLLYLSSTFNNDTVTTTTSTAPSSTPMFSKTSAQEDAFHSILLSTIAIPGYILAVLYLEKVGRKRLQMMGFFIMAMLFMICAVGYDYMLSDELAGENQNMWGKYMFLLIYALTFLFSNFGPNTTTFVIPGEIYPAEVRATCHGLSAASGKLGAAAGAYFFPMVLSYHQTESNSKTGMQRAMAMCAFVALLGVLVTHFFIPKYDSNTLALADARFEEEEDEEEVETEGRDEENANKEEENRDDFEREDEETGFKLKKPATNKVSTSSNLKLIVIALEHDCLLTVKEDDPLFKDICLIRHEDDVYCEDIDAKGNHHRHYSGHRPYHTNHTNNANNRYHGENVPYQAIQNEDMDANEEDLDTYAPQYPATLPWLRSVPNSTNTNTNPDNGTGDSSNHRNVSSSHRSASNSAKNNTTNAVPVTDKNTAQEIKEEEGEEDGDSINSDMSDSEVYRRLEAARMQYERKERESAASACL